MGRDFRPGWTWGLAVFDRRCVADFSASPSTPLSELAKAKEEAEKARAQAEMAKAETEKAKAEAAAAKQENGCTVAGSTGAEATTPDEATRDRLVNLLRSREIFLAGRQADTCSRQVKFKPYPNKIPVYWLSLKALGLTMKDLQIS